MSCCVSAGSLFERHLVVCNNEQDLQDWVEHLTRQTKHTTATAPSHKPLTVPCHTVSKTNAHAHLRSLSDLVQIGSHFSPLEKHLRWRFCFYF